MAGKEVVCQKHPPDEYKIMMKSMDKDRNGVVTWEEFVTAASDKIALLNERNVIAAFKLLDSNNDGSVTKDELSKNFGANPNEKVDAAKEDLMWNEIIKGVDLNGDGKISWNEFKSAM